MNRYDSDGIDNRQWVCQEIARDMERDTEAREGEPLTGANVAKWFGETSASIAALAKVVQTLLPTDGETLGRTADHPDGTPGVDVGVTVSQYTLSTLPENHVDRDLFSLTVDRAVQRDGTMVLWAVRWIGYCLDQNGRWCWEPIPSERSYDWLADHRFDYDTAMRLAVGAARRLTVNGRTVADVLALTGGAG